MAFKQYQRASQRRIQRGQVRVMSHGMISFCVDDMPALRSKPQVFVDYDKKATRLRFRLPTAAERRSKELMLFAVEGRLRQRKSMSDVVMLSLRGVFSVLGIDPKNCAGEYVCDRNRTSLAFTLSSKHRRPKKARRAR